MTFTEWASAAKPTTLGRRRSSSPRVCTLISPICSSTFSASWQFRADAKTRSLTTEDQHMSFTSSCSRKSRSPRVITAVAAAAVMALAITPGRVATASDSRRASRVKANGELQGSYRFERNGWIYVHLEGSPSRVGYQHGYLLAEEIRDLLGVVGPFLQHTTKRDWNFYRRTSEE